MPKAEKFLNIGILAHVDAGKTSITELMLYKSGTIRNMGSVDKGTSQTDWLEIEKQRGISIRSAAASIVWNNININIIDTPGHIDFSSEVERSMLALDCAIIVLSAVEGVQSHSENIWQALQNLNIPCLIFINKIDRIGSDSQRVIEDIHQELSPDTIELQSVINEGDLKVEISKINLHDKKTIEAIVEKDELLLERFFNEEEIKDDELSSAFKNQIAERKAFPILFGSAKLDIGIDELLEFMGNFMPLATGNNKSEVSGIVFKVEHDKNIGKVASVRLFDGSLKNRDLVNVYGSKEQSKISQIRKLLADKYEDIGVLNAGDCGAVCGLGNIKAGDIIGNLNDKIKDISLSTPLLSVKIEPENEKDYSTLVSAMNVLSDEDPKLNLLRLRDERELHIKVMGLIQIEILKSVLETRFNLIVNFGQPGIIYKETPLGTGEGYEEYTMPKPCWAVVRYKIEAAMAGSGVEYHSEVGVNEIESRYQKEIERSIPKALSQGLSGWEVTDIKITLIGGEHHNIHSRAGDFAVATPIAIIKGLQSIGTQILEPILEFTVGAPEEFLGKIASSLTKLRASFGNPEIKNGKFTMSGDIPLATSIDYPNKLNSITAGKAKYKSHFKNYKPCPAELAKTTPYRGINPLDRAKYILRARKAL